MHSIYATSLKTEPTQNPHILQSNYSSLSNSISQSYKDLLFNHLLDIQHRRENNKENLSNPKKPFKRQNQHFKATQTLILSRIPTNFGTLNQFVSEPQQNRVIYTSKKKRNQQATEENILKKRMFDKSSEQKILKSAESSFHQKKIASKVLVQRIFNQVYNTPLQDFVSKNGIRKPKQSRINISTLESLLSSDRMSIISQKNDPSELRLSEDSCIIPIEKKTVKERTVRIKFDQQTKLNKINELKSHYPNLKKLQIPFENQNFSLLIEAQTKLENYLKQISDFATFSRRSSTILNAARNSLLNSNLLTVPQAVNVQKCMTEVSQRFKQSRAKSVVSPDTIAKVTEQEVWFKKMQFKDLEMGLYMISFIQLQRIEVIRLENIAMDESILFLFLDVLCKFAPQIKPLKQVSFCSIAIDSKCVCMIDLMKFSEKVSELLRQINVRRLCLNFIDLGSKQFSKICVGMAKNESLEHVEMRNNRIDCMALKSLETLLKINPNIKTIDLRGNYSNFTYKNPRVIIDSANQ